VAGIRKKDLYLAAWNQLLDTWFLTPNLHMLSEITVTALKSLLEKGEDIQLIDVREPQEYEICHLPGSILIPLGELPGRRQLIAADKPVVVICHHGFRSAQAMGYLSHRFGYQNLINLKGGIHAWALQIDPQMAQY
jgi:rhodanese-related sulfurtransferase